MVNKSHEIRRLHVADVTILPLQARFPDRVSEQTICPNQ
jgi:hypothetical protein